MDLKNIISALSKKSNLPERSIKWYVRRAYILGMKDSTPRTGGRAVNERTISDAVCRVFNITNDQLTSANRNRNIVDARKVFIHHYYPVARSQRQVAEHLKAVKRSTVACSMKSYAELYSVDRSFKEKADMVSAMLYEDKEPNN